MTDPIQISWAYFYGLPIDKFGIRKNIANLTGISVKSLRGDYYNRLFRPCYVIKDGNWKVYIYHLPDCLDAWQMVKKIGRGRLATREINQFWAERLSNPPYRTIKEQKED